MLTLRGGGLCDGLTWVARRSGRALVAYEHSRIHEGARRRAARMRAACSQNLASPRAIAEAQAARLAGLERDGDDRAQRCSATS